MNKSIKDLATKTNCEVVDNDTTFTLCNNECERSSLNRGGLHLSSYGTRKLLKNINEVHQIIKSRNPHQIYDNQHKSQQNAFGETWQTHKSPRQRHHRSRSHQNDNRGCYFCGEANHQMKDCKHGRPIRCRGCAELGHKQGQNMCRTQ